MKNDSKKTKGTLRLGSRAKRGGGASRDISILETFEQQYAWLRGEFERLEALKQTPRVRRAVHELLLRNRQLGRDVIRFLEDEAA